MIAKRWPWLLSGGLLLASGTVAWIVTALWWLPCRGAMLAGTILEATDTTEFSQQCLVRMDSGTPFPLIVAVDGAAPGMYELSALTIGIAALAWLVVVIATPMSIWSRLFGVALTVSLVVLAWAGLQPADRNGPESAIGGYAWELVDLAGLGFVIAYAFSRRWRHAPRSTIRLAAAFIGVTGFGLTRTIVDYIVMGAWSQANWDTPPGSGYLIAGSLLACGLVIIVLTVGRHGSATEPPDVAEPGDRVVLVDTPPAS